MNEDALRRIKSTLKLEYYLMNDEWLRDCVEFYVDQHGNPSIEEILQFVKVQWQLSDLREISNENGSLPCNLAQHKFIMLSENYILQVEQMYDIATSKYKQLEEIRNTHISEVELTEAEKADKWELPKKRMIQLRLTDGVQDVIGIEYSHIPRLNDTLLPGYKVMIMGPVKCRKGVLLLEATKLKGVGGEVDSLLISNALENSLARALNLQENPDPYNDNQTKSNNIKQKETQIDNSFFEEDFEINLEEVSKIEESHTKNQKPNKDIIRTEIKTEDCIPHTTNTEIKKVQSFKEENIFDEDDCFLEMIDEQQFIESHVEQKNIATPFRALPKEGGDDIIIINEENDIINVKYDHLKRIVKEEKQNLQSNSKLFISNTDSSTAISNLKMDRKQQPLLICGKRNVPMSPPYTMPLKKSKIDRKITEFTKATNSCEEPKICEFIRNVSNERVTETAFRTIRGRVEILGKLTKKDSLWILEATIVDGTGTLEVIFSNKVLENLLGFNVQEFSVKKKLKKNPEIEHELRMGFRSAEEKIKTLDALLELELNTNKKPTVIKITDLTQEQKEITDRRLKQFLLKNNV
ncbi:PREDICTED: recQ-mediated genome instability protein 1-like [Habropoda laboriosa]|uniref:recQ-mediated genome instability protein 1-like n=1 Tax=Habropoda laboriosa TaxID=597456 RepID=UPI00083DD8B4|nr:PREDICTED: recQ-mediated genome instability protein 1-like [Habropoda laboriosa]